MAAPLSDSDRDPWHVDSDDSAASVADELVAPAPARGQGPFRRKRGRPRGTPGNPAQRRALRARRADREALIVLPQAPASPQVLLSQWLRQVGHGPLKLVVDYIRAHVVSESSEADSDFAHFMQRALGMEFISSVEDCLHYLFTRALAMLTCELQGAVRTIRGTCGPKNIATSTQVVVVCVFVCL